MPRARSGSRSTTSPTSRAGRISTCRSSTAGGSDVVASRRNAGSRKREAMAEMLVCREGEIAEGGVRVVRAGKVEIGVIRHGGKYYAYRNLCPHQGGPACEGLRMPQVKELIDENGVYHGKTFDHSDMHIVCPWHGYEFHLSDGVHVADKRLRLQKFEVIERNGEVYVAV